MSFYSLRSRQEAKKLFVPLTHPMTKCHILICRFSSGCGYCIDIQLLRAYTVNCGTKKLWKNFVIPKNTSNFAPVNEETTQRRRPKLLEDTLSYGVMVAHRILVPLVRVRVLLRQQKTQLTDSSQLFFYCPCNEISRFHIFHQKASLYKKEKRIVIIDRC